MLYNIFFWIYKQIYNDDRFYIGIITFIKKNFHGFIIAREFWQIKLEKLAQFSLAVELKSNAIVIPLLVQNSSGEISGDLRAPS